LPLIVLEGIDKAGKYTQTRLLEKKLKKRGLDVKSIAFPDYKTLLGKEIKKFLQGEVDFRPEVRQLLYVANRWERQRDLVNWLQRGIYIIADRYIPSGLAYGMANGLSLDWMLKLEEGLPTPDLVIIIDIPVNVSYGREEEQDVYEKDKIFLTKVRSSYHELAKRFHWSTVNGQTEIEKVSQEIWKRIQSSIQV